MPLAVLVALAVAVVVALMGAAGYLIERSATADEPGAGGRGGGPSGPPGPG